MHMIYAKLSYIYCFWKEKSFFRDQENVFFHRNFMPAHHPPLEVSDHHKANV